MISPLMALKAMNLPSDDNVSDENNLKGFSEKGTLLLMERSSSAEFCTVPIQILQISELTQDGKSAATNRMFEGISVDVT
jgi:hypothetical protein